MQYKSCNTDLQLFVHVHVCCITTFYSVPSGSGGEVGTTLPVGTSLVLITRILLDKLGEFTVMPITLLALLEDIDDIAELVLMGMTIAVFEGTTVISEAEISSKDKNNMYTHLHIVR